MICMLYSTDYDDVGASLVEAPDDADLEALYKEYLENAIAYWKVHDLIWKEKANSAFTSSECYFRHWLINEKVGFSIPKHTKFGDLNYDNRKLCSYSPTTAV